MNLTSIKLGDTVECYVRGRVFTAEVLEKTELGLRLQPPPGITYHNVTSRQVRKRVSKAPRTPA